MPEQSRDISRLIEALSMHHILEGLVHNINTPLNVIIGYSQQLKKQYPEIKYLDKITEAGLEIDDLVKACSEAFINRTDSTLESFGLNQWLESEIRLLRNVLEIKHALKFEISISETEVTVNSRPLILSLFFESLVLTIRNKCASTQADRSVAVSVLQEGSNGMVEIKLPLSTVRNIELQGIIIALMSELSESFDIQATDFPFAVEVTDNNQVKITFRKLR
jgi:hypothetical protein